MDQKSNGTLREALTFDDVLLKPGLSNCCRPMPISAPGSLANLAQYPDHRLGHGHGDRAKMAIAMAQAGGLGRHPSQSRARGQAAQVRQVKKFESGMVVNPSPSSRRTLADALELMQRPRISGIPVVEGGGNGSAGKLVGILTNRDVRFATDPRQKVAELMTKERLVTVREASARTRPSASCISTASRSCSWSTSNTAASA
jgi:IMP dehydrogenase